MEERRPDRILATQHGGDRRRPRCCPPDGAGGGGGEDRLSDLPDEMLLKILGGLGSTAEAARTSTLARRWQRPLWTELHVLVFRDLGPGTVCRLLGRASRRNLSRLEIHVPRPRQAGGIATAQITSLLRAAEEHQPEELVLDIGGVARDDVPIELPCFTRATSIDLQIWDRSFTMPPAGELFSCLKRLTLSLCTVLPSVFLPYCPQLQMLHLCCYWVSDIVTISSESLQELILRDMAGPVEDTTPQRVIIEAPVLNKFRLQSLGNRGVSTSISAPMVDVLSFTYCSRASRYIGFSWPWLWRVLSLSTAMEWITRDGQVDPVRLRILSMVVIADGDGIGPGRNAHASFPEEIVRLPVNNFSVLKLELRTEGNTFGTVVLQLLETLNAIQRLQLVLPPSNNVRGIIWWKKLEIENNQHIFLGDLEEVEIEGLNLTYHELDFLKLLFESAPVLKIVRIKLFAGVSQPDQGRKELYCIFRANPSVKCSVNGRTDEE